MGFLRLACTCEETCLTVWPPTLSTQVQPAATCDYLRVRLAKALSPGQTDQQVVTSGSKLNLRRDLRWVAKRTGKFPKALVKRLTLVDDI